MTAGTCWWKAACPEPQSAAFCRESADPAGGAPKCRSGKIWANRMHVSFDRHLATDLGAMGAALELAVAPLVWEALDWPVPLAAGGVET